MSNKIILNSMEQITCPCCDKQFPLRDAITHQLIDRYEDEYEAMLLEERKSLESQLTKELSRQQERKFNAQLNDLKEQLIESQNGTERIKKQLAEAKSKAAEEVRSELLVETKSLQDELEAKNKKLDSYRQIELELRKEKKALEEREGELALEVERKLAAERSVIEAKVREGFSLKEAELKKKISDAQKSNDELTRKLEQGSQQLQGEVLELQIESMLRQCYPFDEVEEVKKGQRGADVIQRVKLRSGVSCGTIVWETKRAENWSSGWVQKLKEDQQEVGGELAVLVTTAFPSGIDDPMLTHEGIWLVKPQFAKGLSEALRTVLIEAQRQKVISSGREEQVEALFDYICSSQFAQRVRSVVECHDEMQDDLEKEKRALQRIWKKREGQITRISTQMMGICGELQGISASALPHLDSIAALDFAE